MSYETPTRVRTRVYSSPRVPVRVKLEHIVDCNVPVCINSSILCRHTYTSYRVQGSSYRHTLQAHENVLFLVPRSQLLHVVQWTMVLQYRGQCGPGIGMAYRYTGSMLLGLYVLQYMNVSRYCNNKKGIKIATRYQYSSVHVYRYWYGTQCILE